MIKKMYRITFECKFLNSVCAKMLKIFCEVLYVAQVCFYSAVCGGLGEFRQGYCAV